MDKFIIEGQHPIKGIVTPSGNKNSALPLLAASLLTEDEIVLDNIPRIRDVDTMLRLLRHLGVEAQWRGANTLALQARRVSAEDLDPEDIAAIRGSVLLMGPMLARNGRLSLPRPGGDAIGRRRVDTHLLVFREMGAVIEIGDTYELRASGLCGADIMLDEMSVTATENALMAAALARGTTTIQNAASEPHVQDTARLLAAMGAQIEGIGSNMLTVHGVERLHGAQYRLAPDYIEIGSFIGLAAALGGEMLIRNAAARNMRMTNLMFGRLGLSIELRGDDLFIPGGQRMRVRSDAHNAVPKIDDAPWPGFPADLMSIMLVAATQAEGEVLIHEKMFESRLFFVDKLIAMGAKIILCDPHRAVVIGPSALHGEPMQSPDIRAGMALLIAALAARGTSQIFNAEIIDRGYENIVSRLQSLGAQIERVHA
ncbi:MAG: UDP-N-acetylglucosamine 1-carboxyvinyltransferase [Chloroflexi bacterium]|nr:UDP-N-acetylglucosamine 1-carboxyvinyltransferase [Chloroflexota bacterium]